MPVYYHKTDNENEHSFHEFVKKRSSTILIEHHTGHIQSNNMFANEETEKIYNDLKNRDNPQIEQILDN